VVVRAAAVVVAAGGVSWCLAPDIRSAPLAESICLPAEVRQQAVDPEPAVKAADPPSEGKTEASPDRGQARPAGPQAKSSALPANVENAVHVYFDASGSMTGYVQKPQPGADAPQLYTDIVLSLPEIVGGRSSPVFFYEFGKKILPLPPARLPQVAKPAFYSCQNPAAIECNNQESHIADPLKRAAEDVDSAVHVIVTDLFLSQGELLGDATSALRRPLVTALRAGKMVAVLGVKTSFTGRVYDLPSAGTYDYAKSRPLFLVFVGAPRKIFDTVERLKSEVLQRAPAGSWQFMQFSQSIVSKPAMVPEKFTQPEKGTRRDPKLLGTEFPYPQLSVGRETPPFAVALSLSKVLWPGSLPASYELTQQIWLKRDGKACGQSWTLLKDPPVATMRQGPEDLQFELFGDSAAMHRLLTGHTYLVQLSARAVSLAREPPEWVKAWSFSARDEEQLVKSRPAFFPALNLEQLVKVFIDVEAEGFEPTLVSHYLVAFHLDR
jgi:hypothetical protein